MSEMTWRRSTVRPRSDRPILRGGVLALALAVAGCAAPLAPTKPTASSGPREVTYRVHFEEPGLLDVALEVRGGGCETLVLESGGLEFIDGLTVEDARGNPKPFRRSETGISSDACRESCTVRYRMNLQLAASYWKNPEYAASIDGALFAPPTSWLLHPPNDDRGTFSLEVSGSDFVSGLNRQGDRYAAQLSDLPRAPYAAFGRLRKVTIPIGESEIELAIAGAEPTLGDEALVAWVREAALDVSGYFGSFPSHHAAVFVIVGDGGGMGHATALGNGGASILARVGKHVERAQLERDWVMTHEMIHLGTVGMHVRHDWMAEGLATYVEPLARASRGRLEPDALWREFYFDMRKGLPRRSDGGLDGTKSWGRTYWGGAIFWFVADVEIRRQSAGKKSLSDCLRAAVASGGTIASRWPVDRFLSACDAGVGSAIVKPLYEKHAASAIDVDLDTLFARLGVHRRGLAVMFDDEAPEAKLRSSLTGRAL